MTVYAVLVDTWLEIPVATAEWLELPVPCDGNIWLEIPVSGMRVTVYIVPGECMAGDPSRINMKKKACLSVVCGDGGHVLSYIGTQKVYLSQRNFKKYHNL